MGKLVKIPSALGLSKVKPLPTRDREQMGLTSPRGGNPPGSGLKEPMRGERREVVTPKLPGIKRTDSLQEKRLGNKEIEWDNPPPTEGRSRDYSFRETAVCGREPGLRLLDEK